MKCKNCGSAWHAGGQIERCPFCQQTCMLPEAEVLALVSAAVKMSDEVPEEKAKAWLAAAEHGHPDALYAYGRALDRGEGVVKSPSRAAAYYLAAAEQGHAASAYRLSLFLRRRHLGKKEADLSYFWLRVGAELGDPEAACLLADCYAKGEGIAENPLRAAYWYTRASEEGVFLAAYRLSRLYRDGRGVRKNPAYEKYYAEIAYNGGIRAAERSIRLLAAERIFSEVPARIEIKHRNEDRFELGYRAYADGRYRLAYLLYSLAARDGYARAQNHLGVCLENGQGTGRDEASAVSWYRMAAEGGCDMAWVNLGNALRDGRGVEADEAAAFACYMRAAENGLPHAQYVVACCYFNADLVDRDIPVAMKWYERAALGGDAAALDKVNEVRADMTELYNRGVDAYENGFYEDAVKFYSIAAEFGHRGAQCNLGYLYQNGLGCEKNDRYAVHYYRRAAEAESGMAELNLALCYLRGEGGLPYDYRAANELLLRAEAHGATGARDTYDRNMSQKKKKLAQRIFAISCIALRRGGQEELADVIRFRQIAAAMGNGRAMFALGCHYEFGFGVPANEKTASAWYTRAYAAGYRQGAQLKSAILKSIHRPQGFARPAAEPAEVATE